MSGFIYISTRTISMSPRFADEALKSEFLFVLFFTDNAVFSVTIFMSLSFSLSCPFPPPYLFEEGLSVCPPTKTTCISYEFLILRVFSGGIEITYYIWVIPFNVRYKILITCLKIELQLTTNHRVLYWNELLVLSYLSLQQGLWCTSTGGHYIWLDGRKTEFVILLSFPLLILAKLSDFTKILQFCTFFLSSGFSAVSYHLFSEM